MRRVPPRAGDDAVDADVVAGLRAEAARDADAGEPAAAAGALERALDLWRGEALGDLTAPAARAIADELDGLRVDVTEDLAERYLALGRPRDVVPLVASLVQAHPLRARLRGQLMLALYRAGRPETRSPRTGTATASRRRSGSSPTSPSGSWSGRSRAGPGARRARRRLCGRVLRAAAGCCPSRRSPPWSSPALRRLRGRGRPTEWTRPPRRRIGSSASTSDRARSSPPMPSGARRPASPPTSLPSGC